VHDIFSLASSLNALEGIMKKYLEFYVFLKTLKIMEASKANDVCRPVTDPHIQPVVLLLVARAWHTSSSGHASNHVPADFLYLIDNCFDILLRVYRHILHVIYKDNLG